MSDADAASAWWRGRWVRALLAGGLVAFSLPPWGWWPLAFVGTTLFEGLG